MANTEHIRQAIYESPSGKTFTLLFNDVSRSGGKKASIHELTQQNTAYIQDLGNTAVRFPFSCYLLGDDYNTQSDALFDALSEKGPGIFQHPRYGNIVVLPLTWIQSEDLVAGVGRANFDIEFITVSEAVGFPKTSVAIEETIASDTDEAMSALSEIFATEFSPVSASDRSICQTNALSDISEWKSSANAIVAGTDDDSLGDIASQFDALIRDFELYIDDYLDGPTLFIEKFTSILRLPAQAAGRISAKVSAYYGGIQNAINSVPTSLAQALVYVSNLFGLVSGAAQASTIGDIISRQDAVRISEMLSDLQADAQSGIEAAETATGFVAPVTIMAVLADVISQARDALIVTAYDLRNERVLILEASRTPLDLVYELYGSLDNLDEFITTNNLQGDAIILIPAGTKVVWYE